MSGTLIMAGATDRGRVRTVNEDAFALDAETGLVLIADGMGGHNAGDVASRMAKEYLVGALGGAPDKRLRVRADRGMSRLATFVKHAVLEANAQIFTASGSVPEYRQMGTTIVLALFCSGRVIVAHVGDSRLYRLRDRRLELLTTDHSLVEDLVAQGQIHAKEAVTHCYRNVLTRALGTRQGVEVDVQEFPVNPGDTYLLCSDGLWGQVPEAHVEAVLTACKGDWDEVANELVQRANETGGPDNISVAVVHVLPKGLMD